MTSIISRCGCRQRKGRMAVLFRDCIGYTKAAEELRRMAAERTDLAKAKAEAEQAKSQLSAELEGTS